MVRSTSVSRPQLIEMEVITINQIEIFHIQPLFLKKIIFQTTVTPNDHLITGHRYSG